MRPVVAGFHPDPSICRVGEDYYLACSSFEYFPGVPVFHSRDLRVWQQVGNALGRPSQLSLAVAPSSGGIYAPTLRYRDGRFWLVTTNVSDRGNLLVTAEDPAGAWSDPVWLPGVPGIDPDLAWDEEGNCWCTVAGIDQVRIDPVTGTALTQPRRVWDGTPGAWCPEAPHLYRIGDLWYLMIAEGGTERGHCFSVARGPSPTGPFEPCPRNPILTHRGMTDPIQNVGHADLVQAPDGTWWMVFLGVRWRGGSPGYHVLGRESFLAPVSWVDGWPVVGPLVSGLAVADPQPRDHFDAADLAPCWVSIRERPAAACSLSERPGWLSLHARGSSLDDRTVTFVGRRQAHLSCKFRALVDASAGAGGVAVRMDERHHYAVEVDGGDVYAHVRIGPLRQTFGVRECPSGPVVLRIEAGPVPSGRESPRQGPDVIRLGVEDNGRFEILAEVDGRYLSTEVAGGFTGRVIGGYAKSGTIHIDWMEYLGRE